MKITHMQNPVAFILETCFEDLPKDVVRDAIRALIDTLGVAAAASQTQLSRIIHAHAASQFGGGRATLWQDGRKVSPAGAALANGMSIDSLDAHDGHKLTKGHVGCGVIPAAISVFENEGLSDPLEFLTTITIGYEIGTRAGIALHKSACDYHTSGAWIALATAAMTARSLGLDVEHTREALGIAEYHGPRSQMMRCIDYPTMVKDGSGWGAMAGVSAGYLARDGFTGAPAISMEAEDLGQIWGDLGKRWYIQEQYIKLYPVCRWAQPAVEAVLALVRLHGITPGLVVGIDVETFHEAKCLAVVPNNTEQAQYSLPFPVAAAIVRGTVGVAEVSEDGLNDPEIMHLARMVKVSDTDAYNAAFPARRFAKVHIMLSDGRKVSSETTEAQGDPENRLDDSIIAQKFDRLVVPMMGANYAQALRTCLTSLPIGGDLEALFAMLAVKAI